MTFKSSAILLGCIVYSISASSQIKKKAILIGGQIGYSKSDSESNASPATSSSSSSGTTFTLSLGTAIKENSVIGIRGSYASSTSENVETFYPSYNKSNDYTIGGYFRKYKKLGGDFYVFGDLGVAYIGGKETNRYNPFTTDQIIKVSGASLSIMPGLAYKILKKVHIELIIPNLVSIRSTKTRTTNGNVNSKENQFAFNSSLNSNGLGFLGVGFHLVF